MDDDARGGDVLDDEPPVLLTREICSRWYKSPEMLLGAYDYTFSVDLWATGCILGDLLSPVCKALFPGGSDIEQLCLIFHTLGTPVEEEWPGVVRLPDYPKVQFTPSQGKPFEFEEQCSSVAITLLHSFLRLNPDARISAEEAIRSDVFGCEPVCSEPLELLAGLPDERPPDLPDEGDQIPSDLAAGFGHGFYGSSSDSGDYEPIEPNTCEPWDATVSGDCADKGSEAPRAPGTPPLPSSGAHRFKPGRGQP